MSDSPDPVPPVQPDHLHGLGSDQVVPVLVESFTGMFDILFNIRNIYGNGKINARLLIMCLIKLFISLSVLLACVLIIMALNYFKNQFLVLPSLFTSFFPNTNITTVIQTLLPIILA